MATLHAVSSPSSRGSRGLPRLASSPLVHPLPILLVLLSGLLDSAAGCLLGAWGQSNGFESGYCEDFDQYQDAMPYCSEWVTYRACVPVYQDMWPNHTITKKDQWVSDMYRKIVQERKDHEMNETLKELGIDEYGTEGGEVIRRFWNGDKEDPWGVGSSSSSSFSSSSSSSSPSSA